MGARHHVPPEILAAIQCRLRPVQLRGKPQDLHTGANQVRRADFHARDSLHPHIQDLVRQVGVAGAPPRSPVCHGDPPLYSHLILHHVRETDEGSAWLPEPQVPLDHLLQCEPC